MWTNVLSPWAAMAEQVANWLSCHWNGHGKARWTARFYIWSSRYPCCSFGVDLGVPTWAVPDAWLSPCWQAGRQAGDETSRKIAIWSFDFSSPSCKRPVHNAEVAYRWLDCMWASEEVSAQGISSEGLRFACRRITSQRTVCGRVLCQRRHPYNIGASHFTTSSSQGQQNVLANEFIPESYLLVIGNKEANWHATHPSLAGDWRCIFYV